MELTKSATLFLKEIDTIRYPSADEERILILRGKRGDIKARNELIWGHSKYLLRCMNSYKDQGVEFMDLVQAGFEGMIHAFEKFNPELKFRFLVYATHWIHRKMNELVYKQGSSVIRPYKFRSRRSAIWMLQNHYCIHKGRLPTVHEIARVLGMKESEVFSHLDGEIISLDKVIDTDTGTKREIHELFPSGEQNLDDELAERDEHEWQRYELMRILQSLNVSVRDKKIFIRRNGLDGSDEVPVINQIAKEFGVSKVTAIAAEKKVRVLIKEALTQSRVQLKQRSSSRWSRNVKKR